MNNVLSNALERGFRVVDRVWPVLARLMRGHAYLYRATGGLLGARLPFTPPILLLDHVGARSGKRRTTPLVYMRDGERFVIFAGKGGHPKNPAWLYNLRAHPDTEVQIKRDRIAIHARELRGEARNEMWPKALAYTAHWRRYAARTEREIPLLILEPRRPAGRSSS